jgi:hypothetical protein
MKDQKRRNIMNNFLSAIRLSHCKYLGFLSFLFTFGYALLFFQQDSMGGADPWQKITFDISKLDESGLHGPPGGKRALSYEFCIPDTVQNRTEVKRIDPTVKFFAQSPGRIGCGESENLCIGSTHQKEFRGVLQRLAELTYVKRIDESFFE